MEHFKRFWRDLNLVRESRSWLKANQKSTLVMDAMFHLNHEVKGYPSRSRYAAAVYALKNELIKWLYENGYCVHVTKERQTFECWDCGGTGSDGWHDYDQCLKCDGTGIYREHVLYRFVFEYNGRRYIWHQPSGLVTWSVELSNDEIRPFQEPKSAASKSIGNTYYNYYTGVVHAFLRMNGVPKNRLPTSYTLRMAIRDEWEETHLSYSIRRLRRRVQYFKWAMDERVHNLKRLWTYVSTGELPVREADYDDIPF